MGGDGIDIGGHHVGLDLVRVDQPAATLAHRVDQSQQFPGLGSIAQVGIGHARPDGCVRVLPAIFAHARQVALDVAGVEVAVVEGWVEQFDDADVAAHQMLVQRGHGGLCSLGRGNPGQHRPALCQRVDAALLVARRAQQLAVVEPGAQVPAAVPGMLFQVFGQGGRLLAALQGEGAVAVAQGEAGERPQYLVTEETQPHAFAKALFADAVHAVIPVPAAHQRQAVGAILQGMPEGALAMLVQALDQVRLGGQVVIGLFTGIQRTPLQVADRFVQHRAVANKRHVAAGCQRQP
ncbi:hypothetical protein D3C81_608920 [compost metagenome]